MTDDIERNDAGRWVCPKCKSEWTSPLAAVACMEDDLDRHNTRGYD